jgi:hypothetical protein
LLFMDGARSGQVKDAATIGTAQRLSPAILNLVLKTLAA